MKILAIDTSTSFATIAVAVENQVVAELLLNTNRTLSARLIPEIERVIATAGLGISDIDLFASSIGPGSFTGIRGGVATIQGLALATGKPCVGFSSLEMLAMNFSLSSTLICPMLDARKSEVYAALYNLSSQAPIPLISDGVFSPEDILNEIAAATEEPVIFLGDGAVRYHDIISNRLASRARFPNYPLNHPRPSNAVTLALNTYLSEKSVMPSELLPIYLRASDAEINHNKRLTSAGYQFVNEPS
ncbi:MAG: tRNA (adenosine(37)-N6)-threonylcarbamoyltransferase complex dimerization subunit type 1 TsaB [Desulfuromonadaceae bacterium]|nr:tRNA (adenosine(37)-N6)-threonylcarbamoyltransferase complex dimerization subunit type 1 TsaB [Desulfuromonadaceae bacterium]MDD2854476.1 tRNA (adenosine(37)-N6)-threonylcarbamoyltransferase complex dimerization subunit type 1 TsaB [Desulfuromonadaceae bacterium]